MAVFSLLYQLCGGKIQRLRENIPVSLQIAAMLVQQLPTQNAQMVRMQEKILPELLEKIGLAPGDCPACENMV